MSEERRRAQEFADALVGIYGDTLACVLLYGSAARGEYRAGLSDVNLLVILEDIGIDVLRQGASVTREWVSAGNSPPLVLSRREWLNSADVFPLEYSDIRDAHVLLAGREPFEEMRISREHLRLQVEHELRSRRIQLRAGLLVAGESSDELARLLLKSLPTFLVLFRAMLRVDGQPVPGPAREVVEAIARVAELSPAPVLAVMTARDTMTGPTPELDGDVAAGYLVAIDRAIVWLDGLTPRSGLSAEI